MKKFDWSLIGIIAYMFAIVGLILFAHLKTLK